MVEIMKQELQKIYQLTDSRQATRRLRVWCWWVKRTSRRHCKIILASMIKAAEMIENHFEGVAAHWASGLTNAFMEGLNSVFQAIKRRARGYRNSVYLITMLYFTAGKLRLPAK